MMQRTVLLTVVGSGLLGGYLFINHHPLSAPRVVNMPEWIPFVPWLAPAYLSVLFIWWYLPLALLHDRHFRAWMRASVIAFLITATVWILVPTTLPRPDFSPAWWNLPYYYLTLTDPPNNICPCGHILAPMVGTWFLSIDRPRWRPWLLIGLGFSALTIALTWQHRPVDILIGAAIALIGLVATHTWGAASAVSPPVAKTDQ